MKKTKDRLAAVMRDGNLRVSDLARWFGRPHATVRLWCTGNSDVGGTIMDKAFVLERLHLLERIVRKRHPLIPPGLKPKERIVELEKAMTRVNAGLKSQERYMDEESL